MPTLLQDTALPTITLGEWTTSRGGQTCNLSVDNQPFIVQLNKQKEPLFAPFGLNVYGDEKTNQEAKRLNLDLDITERPDIIEKLTNIDERILSHLDKQNKFKSLNDTYRHMVTSDERYGSKRLRLKVNVQGLSACSVWNAESQTKVEARELDYRNAGVCAIIQFKSVYAMSKQIGVICEAKTLLVSPKSEECPIALME